MQKFALALTVLVTLGGVGCTSDSDDDTPPGDGGGGGGGGDAPPFTNGVSTLSGAADAGTADGPRGTARFANPVNVALGPDGTLYVADFDNGRIRAVDAETGETSTVIAMGGFERVFGMTFGPDGTLYVSTDRTPMGMHGPMSGTIWRVDVNGRVATPIVVGIGRPRGLAMLPSGMLAASDYTHHVIQLVDTRTGAVTPLAGAWDQPGMVDAAGAAARFSRPYDLAVISDGIVVADHGNNRLRLVRLDGTVTTYAGSGAAGYADGPRATARFNGPQGVAAADNGDLYVTDTGNYRIRRISGGNVETLAGDGTAGYRDDDNPLAAQLHGIEGLDVEPDGSRVYVADGTRGENVPFHRVRRIEVR